MIAGLPGTVVRPVRRVEGERMDVDNEGIDCLSFHLQKWH